MTLVTTTVKRRPAAEVVPLADLPVYVSPARIYLEGLSPGSRRTMRGALETMAAMLGSEGDAFSFPWHRIDYQQAQEVRAKLAERYAPKTANKMLAGLRQVLKTGWRLGQMASEDYYKAVDVARVQGTRLPAGRAITQGELHALMAACAADPTAAGVRDGCIVAVLYSCGLRVAEIVNLDLDDYDPEVGTLRVLGKGNKERVAFVINGTSDALADWLILRGDAAGALFWPGRRGGHLSPGRLSTQGIYQMLQMRASQAGISRLSPHDFRRTFISDLLDAGADLATVQRLAGHADPKTTARYDRRPEAARRRAAGLLHVPYQRRTLGVTTPVQAMCS